MAERALRVRYLADVADVERAMRQMQRNQGQVAEETQKTSRRFADLGKVAKGALIGVGVAAVAGFGAAVKQGIDMNAQLETTTLQFETLMGSSDKARAHVKSLFEFAKKTPFETAPIIAASRYMETFGGAALNTKANLTLFGDAAAATSTGIEEVSFWVSRAYSNMQAGRPWGESAMRLQEMGILSGEARQKLEDLSKSGADGAAVWAAFQQEVSKFGGAMEKQAGTFSGMVSTAKDAIAIFLGDVMRPFFEASKVGLDRLVAFAETDAWENIAKGAGKMAVGTLKAFGAMIDAIQATAGFLDDHQHIILAVAAAYTVHLIPAALLWTKIMSGLVLGNVLAGLSLLGGMAMAAARSLFTLSGALRAISTVAAVVALAAIIYHFTQAKDAATAFAAEVGKAADTTGGRMREIQDEIDRLSAKIDTGGAAVVDRFKAIITFSASTEQKIKALEEQASKLGTTWTEETRRQQEAFRALSQTVSTETATQVQALKLTEDELKELAKQSESFSSQVRGHFDLVGGAVAKFEETGRVSFAKFKAELEKQIADMTAWAANLKILMDRNVSPAILEPLATMGPKAGPILAALVQEVEKHGTAAVNELGAKMQSATSAFDHTLRDWKTRVESQKLTLTGEVKVDRIAWPAGQRRMGGPQEFQHGGPIRAGQLALVGEKGPELFVPRSAGQIVPNRQLGVVSLGGIGPIVLELDSRVVAEVTREQLLRMAHRSGAVLQGTA